MSIREFFATIRGATDLAWQSFLDLDIVWTLKAIGSFAIPIAIALWFLSIRNSWLERRALEEQTRNWRDEFDD